MTDPSPSSPPAAVSGGDERAAAKLAMAWTHTARFLTTASKLAELPVSELPEIAFVGRSNAGKSTAINVLTQQKRLAFASKTPGRTQHINLFELGPKLAPDALFADLPGYGYAAVERSAKLRWQQVMAEYLQTRRNLAAIVMLLDSRLGFTEIDRNLLEFVVTAHRQRLGQVAGAADQDRQVEPTRARRAMAGARTRPGRRAAATDEPTSPWRRFRR